MEIIYNDDWKDFSVSIYLADTQQGGKKVIYGQKGGELIGQTLNDAEFIQPIEPLLKMPRGLAEEFIQAMANYLSKKNITTENENLLKGKLAATEKHLEDMRKHFDKVLNKALA